MSLLKNAISISEKAILADAKQPFQELSNSERVLPIYNHNRLHLETLKLVLFVDLCMHDAADCLKNKLLKE